MSVPPSPPLPDRYAMLGNPVEHSQLTDHPCRCLRGRPARRSPTSRIESPLDGFEATVRRFIADTSPAAIGLAADDGPANGLGAATFAGTGLGPPRGCNITVPFKFQMLSLALRTSAPNVRSWPGAVNTLRFDETSAGVWTGDNTDGAGLVQRHPAATPACPLTGLQVRAVDRRRWCGSRRAGQR